MLGAALDSNDTCWALGCVQPGAWCGLQVVLQELDGLKKGMSDRACASREASRFLEDLAVRNRQALRFARFGTNLAPIPSAR